ncbi:MAG: R3H domain-containing nucleic acid-binding protein [Candidatus Saccharibacteria bacterium]|nr:R3H domain-containing nucleic acid-binding protein [Candidatus Saccharibacteria bacterium]
MDTIATIAFAKKFLEDVLAFFDVNLEVRVTIEDDILVAAIPSSERNSILIGRGAETLRSVQYLLGTILRNRNAAVSRVNIDIADYKKQHAERIAEKARGWIEEVRRSGETKIVDLNAADRWVVHHVASEYSDIETHSEGEGRERRLVISQKSS